MTASSHSPASPRRPQTIAFLTPSLIQPGQTTVDGDLPWTRPGVPRLTGFLERLGYGPIRHHTFDRLVTLRNAKEPPIDWEAYADPDAIRRYLQSGDGRVARQTDALLSRLGVAEADVFGIALTRLEEYSTPLFEMGLGVVGCLAHGLKQRWPGARCVVGGLSFKPISQHYEVYERLLGAGPDIDYAVVGAGEPVLRWLLETSARGQDLEPHLPTDLRFRPAGAGGVLWQPGSEDSTILPAMDVFDPVDPDPPRGANGYDLEDLEGYRVSGGELAERYGIPDALAAELTALQGRDFLVLPQTFSYGCNGQCAFCHGAGQRTTGLDGPEAVRAIRYLRDRYDCHHFTFLNTELNGRTERTTRFLDELVAADLDLLWEDSFNLRFIDEALVEKLRAAGCVRAMVGTEYPARRMMRYIRKGIDPERARDSIRLLHEAGIWVHLLLIPGLPTETEDDLTEALEWVESTASMVDCYTVSPFFMSGDSPFARAPGKFGLELLDWRGAPPNPHHAFNEVGGLDWDEKKEQIQHSKERFRTAIERAKGHPKYWDDATHRNLLFWLYRGLGHDRKADIAHAYHAALSGDPLLDAVRDRLLTALAPQGPVGQILAEGTLRFGSAAAVVNGALRWQLHSDTAEARYTLRRRGILPKQGAASPTRLADDRYELQWTAVDELKDDAPASAPTNTPAGGDEQTEALHSQLLDIPALRKLCQREGWRVVRLDVQPQRGVADVFLERNGKQVELGIRPHGDRSQPLVRGGTIDFHATDSALKQLGRSDCVRIGEALLALMEPVTPPPLSPPTTPVGSAGAHSLTARLGRAILQAASPDAEQP